ncbi:MAG: hypothetical protein QXY79_04690 [Candidatus Methanomethylicia archaeon]
MQDFIPQISNSEDMDNLFNIIYTKKERKPVLKATIIFSRLTPEQLVEFVHSNDVMSKKYSISNVKLETNLYRIVIKKQLRKREMIATGLIRRFNSTWVIFTVCNHYAMEHILMKLVDETYPEITTLYLNRFQILKILDKIKELKNRSRVLTSFTIFVKGKGKKSYSGQNVEEELYREVKDNIVWIKNVRFKILLSDNIILSDVSISNNGILKLYYGSFTEFYKTLVKPVLDGSMELSSSYNRVKRYISEKDKDIILTPCYITYPKNLDKESLKNFTSKLSNSYIISITHSVNPYLEISVLDHREGSSFGLTILGNKVIICPMLKTTATAIWKLTSKIQKILGEGEITVM